MRKFVVSAAALFCLGGALVGSARAERRMFIIANDADGYGIDRCLATGAKCGAHAANSYCKSHAFADAASYNKVDREEITGSIPDGGGACNGATCKEFVAIVCNR
jgi:hypothetical protein